MNFSMKCLASEDKLNAWFPVLLCGVLVVLWTLPALGKGIDCISEVEHLLMEFLLPTDIIIMSVVVGRRNPLLYVGSKPQGGPSITILKVLSFEDMKFLIRGQKNACAGLIEDQHYDPQCSVVS